MTSVFVSYARDDDEVFVERLATELQAHGFAVWLDRSSMPSRGPTFLQELRDAIDHQDRFLLVVTPRALASDYTRAEWQHALLLCKPVTPVLRQGDHRLLPDDLSLLHAIDMRASRPRGEAFGELVRALSDPIRPLGVLSDVPALPAHFLDRPKELQELQDAVLTDVRRPVVITAAAQTASVQGMGGIGKSVLAAALARHCATRRAFADGITWLTLGQHPDLAVKVRNLGRAMGDDPRHYLDLESGRLYLARILFGKSCLLILDDIWDIAHAEPFKNALGPRCRLLATTRNAQLSKALGSLELRLDVLADDQALHLLSNWSGQKEEELPAEAFEVMQECGNLPLALSMIGAMVRGKPHRWESARDKLRGHRLQKIGYRLPNYPHSDLLRAIEVSLEALEPKLRLLYGDFALFPEDFPVPEAVLQRLWQHRGLGEDEVRDILDTFQELSLVQCADPGRFTLHDLQFDYVQGNATDVIALHNLLLQAYAVCCPESWATGPKDGYFFENLVWHLLHAGRVEELCSLLVDFDWLQAKLEATDFLSLSRDYELALASLASGDPSAARQRRRALLQAFAKALHRDSHLLSRRADLLWQQLYNRLQWADSRELRELLARARARRSAPRTAPWMHLKVPLMESEALVRTLVGHKRGVQCCSISPDGTLIVSGGDDATVRIWNARTGMELAVLSGHTEPVDTCTVSADGRRILSFSHATSSTGATLLMGTVKVWDVATGRELATLTPHAGGVKASAISSSGNRVATVSEDYLLKVWDVRTGQEICACRGHIAFIRGWAVSPDRSFIVSASVDGTLRVWEMSTGRQLRALEVRLNMGDCVLSPDGASVVTREEKTVRIRDLRTGEARDLFPLEGGGGIRLAISPDGRLLVVSAGYQNVSLTIWNLATGTRRAVLKGHSEEVQALALSRDGAWLASGSRDATLRVWDTRTGVLRATLQGHEGPIHACSLSPDGRQILSAGEDGTLRLWDGRTGEERRVLRGHTGAVTACSFLAEGEQLASAGTDGTVRIWEARTGEQLSTIATEADHYLGGSFSPDGTLFLAQASDYPITLWDGCTGEKQVTLEGRSYPHALALSADGSLLAADSGRQDGDLEVWDVQTGQRLARWVGHEKPAEICVFSADGSSVVSSSADRTIRIWDVRAGRERARLEGHHDPARQLAMSPSGSVLVARGRGARTLKVFDAQAGRELATLAGHTDIVLACAISPDDSYVVSGSADKTLKLWDTRTGRERATLEGHADDIEACTVSPSGDFVVSASGDGTLKIWNAATGTELRRRHHHSGQVRSCVMSPDGRFFASASYDHTLKVWSPDTGELVATLIGHSENLDDCAVSPQGDFLVSASRDHTLKIWDTRTWSERVTLRGHGDLLFVTISPDGSFLVSASHDKTLKIWDARSGKERTTLRGHTTLVHECVVSPDSRFVVSCDWDGMLKVWSVQEGREVATLKGHSRRTLSCAMSPDGSFVLSASDDGTLKVWDARTWQERVTLRGHTAPVTACLISPDARLIVSASEDTTIRLWDASSGAHLSTLTGHTEKIQRKACAMSPDGRLVLSGSDDRTLRLWDLQTGKEQALAPVVDAVSCVAFHPWLPKVACGDEGGNVYLFDLVGTEYGPLVVTAIRERDRLSVRCPACLRHSTIGAGDLGRVIGCKSRNCRIPLRLSSFEIPRAGRRWALF